MKESYPVPITGTALLGEIISWTCPALRTTHAQVIEALRDAGLDEATARELAPRDAFRRACKRLARERIIRALEEDAGTLTFQFTSEKRADGQYAYELETLLTLEKATGKITCDLPGLAMLAQEELDRCLTTRQGADISRILHRLFENQADLFAVRDRGGVYFCPSEHADFLGTIQKFMNKLNGKLARFPVPAGTPQGDCSVKEAVSEGLARMIGEHQSAVASFGHDTREDTLHRASERIRITRHKLWAYSAYLAEQHETLDRELTRAAEELKEKIAALAAPSLFAEVSEL